MDHHKNIQGGGLHSGKKTLPPPHSHIYLQNLKKGPWLHDAWFSVVDEKKRDFILKKPAAATHPTSRAKLTEEFLYFDDWGIYIWHMCADFWKQVTTAINRKEKSPLFQLTRWDEDLKKPIFYVKNSKDFIYFYNRLSSKQKVWDSVNERRNEELTGLDI